MYHCYQSKFDFVLLGDKKNVKTIKEKEMSRRLQALNQLTSVYEVNKDGNLCPRPARFMTTTQKDAYLGKLMSDCIHVC